MSAKILLYDIETSTAEGHFFGKKFQTNISKVTKYPELLSVAWKWLGQSTIYLDTRQGETTDARLAKKIGKLIKEADVVIAHNGDQFDVKVVRTRLAKHNGPVFHKVASVDTCASARRYFAFPGNSLADLADFFSVGRKYPHQGVDLWIGCQDGDPKAWAIMEKYNKHDVYLLEAVYSKLRPWIENHPNIGRLLKPAQPGVCPDCGSENVMKNGIRPSMQTVQQRWACKDCGKPFLTAYKKGSTA